MPPLWAVVIYWLQEREAPLGGDGRIPHCFRCLRVSGYDPMDGFDGRWNNSGLERAHLVDRALGGLDGAQNLMPLCWPCHKVMPSFGPGEGPDAIAWIRRDGRRRLRILPPGDLRDYPHFAAESGAHDLLSGEAAWNRVFRQALAGVAALRAGTAALEESGLAI